MGIRPLITVFGSHNPKPGDEEYVLAENLGIELKRAGYMVASGGYGGIMEAVLKGAGGGIGYTVSIFTAPPNSFVTETKNSVTMFQRIELMLRESDGFICMKGGTGTLLELAAAWEFVNKKMERTRPIVCLGDFWRPVVERLTGEPTIDNIRSLENQSSSAADYISFAATPAQAIAILKEHDTGE